MAQNLTVKPAYLNNTRVMIDGVLTLLTNNLTQAQLLAIWEKPEYNSFITIEYVNVQDSFQENFQIDPNLFNTYDSGQISHDITKTNYPANTTGQYLNETRGVLDATNNSFKRPSNSSIYSQFRYSKYLEHFYSFSRASAATYIDKNGSLKTVGVNKARFTHDTETLEPMGLLLEPARTNKVPNSSFFGFNTGDIVPGSIIGQKYGSSNNNYTFSSVGKEKGIDVGVINAVGTIMSTNQLLVSIFGSDIPILTSTKYGVSFYYKIDTGNWNLDISYVSSGGAVISSSSILIANTTSLSRFEYVTGVSPTNASYIRLVLRRADVSPLGTVYDFSFTIGSMQLEQGDCVTSYIQTTNGIVTRQADSLAISSSVLLNMLSSYMQSGGMVLDVKYTGGTESFIELKGNDGAGPNFVRISLGGGYFRYDIVVNGGNTETYTKFNTMSIFRKIALLFAKDNTRVFQDGVLLNTDNSINIPLNIDRVNLNIQGVLCLKSFQLYKLITDSEAVILTKSPQFEYVSLKDLRPLAFLSLETIQKILIRQEFSIDGTGASFTRNIRRPYDFYFELVDTTGYTAMTSQPPATLCSANTDYPLTVNLPVGKTLTYAIVPAFDN